MTTLTISIPDSETKIFKELVKKFNGKILKSDAGKAKGAKSPYDPKFVAEILKGEQAFKAGKKGVRVDVDNLWK